MNQREEFHSFSKRPLPTEPSYHDHNHQYFRQNAAPNQHLNSSSSQLYNQFISDYPFNGPLKNDNEFNQISKNCSKTNFTFGNEPYFFDNLEQHQPFFQNQEDVSDQSLENSSASVYNDIAFQAQQLLDKINNNFQDYNSQPNNPSSHYNKSDYHDNRSFFNSKTNQSSPAPKLQPILQNAGVFRNRNSEQKISNSNHIITQPPMTHIRHLNQYQPNDFNSNFNFTDLNQPNQNIPKKTDFNQCQKLPQATFASPNFLVNTNYGSNMKRLNTASEMIYPDNHIELLRHSYDS